jgi:hypothetical protein
MANQGIGNLGFGGGSVGTSSGLPIVIIDPPQTPNVLDISGTAGNSAATWKSFTFVVFSGTILIDGHQFKKGSYTYSNGDGTLNAIPYDATASPDCKLMIQS